MSNFQSIGTLLLLASMCGPGAAEQTESESGSPLDVFEQRIMPIFKSPKPSSCVQCHLSAVDLKNYILPSHEGTFASLRDQGLIDLENPKESKILTLIRMGDDDLDKGARLIHEKMRDAEYDAFAAWIEACCDDPILCATPSVDRADRAGPTRPDAVIRHARKSRVLDSFVRNIWSQRMRCFPCHTPFELDEDNPRHQKAIERQHEFRAQYGEELAERIKFFRETPEATMKLLVERSRQPSNGQFPLINARDPQNSLLVLKPTSKIPPKDGEGRFMIPAPGEPMAHLGGLKMHRDDQSYKAFVAWIQDYGRTVNGEYTSTDELPHDNWHPTQRVLRISSVPGEWPVGIPVQLFVHSWNDKAADWSPQPVAFTQGTVTPAKKVNGALFLLGPNRATGSPQPADETAALAPGRYLIKSYVDLQHRLAADPALLLGEDDFYAAAEVKNARWRETFRRAEVVDGKLFTK